MTLNRSLAFLLFITAALPTYAQKKDSCFLRWKLRPDETISYRIIKHLIDTPTNRLPSFSGLFSSKDNSSGINKASKGIDNFFKSMSGVDQNMIAHMKKNNSGKIDVDLILDDETVQQTDSTLNTMAKRDSLPNISGLFKQISGQALTRGVISEDGQIESFYTTANERNLIALFFQLPAHYVRIGDSWPLDIHFVSITGYFKCDSSFRNNLVTVTDIQRENGDYLIYLAYNISEYASGYLSIPLTDNSQMKTLMKVEYKGTACFSINKGRWISFKGTMSNRSDLWSSAQLTERYSLVEKL